nr:BtrH N-terminal domain-containing protein [Candidatus Njordarchaeota archaeon]
MHEIPFVGRMSYCYSKCLCMIFRFLGNPYELRFVECVTTVPFGFVYMPYEKGGFAVNGYNPHEGTERAVKTLRYEGEFKCFQSDHEAFSELRKELRDKPVILGPLDMGFLVYDPYCRSKRGGDHYVVALGIEEDHVIVHDPDGYPCVPIPIRDLSNSWRAEAIGYKKGSYSMWMIKKRIEIPPTETVYRTTLLLGLQNLSGYKSARIGKRQNAYFRF